MTKRDGKAALNHAAEKLRNWCVILGLLLPGLSIATTVWNPAANGIFPPAVGNWADAANWTLGVPGIAAPNDVKAVFNVANAAECQVTDAQALQDFSQGEVIGGGVVRITSTGALATTGAWGAVGYSAPAHLIVDAGGSVTWGGHMWFGIYTGADGIVDIAGTFTQTAGILGLGTIDVINPGGGVCTINVLDGGLLALNNIHGDGASSIMAGSLINIQGSGQLTLAGDFTGALQNYVAAGKIKGEGVLGNVEIDLTTNPGFTTVMAADSEPPEETVLQLAIRHLGGSDLELSWSKEIGAYEPKSTDDLMNTDPWAWVNGSITISSNQCTQAVTADDPNTFYRLYPGAVDNTTLSNKSMMGYQGWFTAPNDASPVDDRWHHWATAGLPDITSWGIDFYPDMSEYSADELYEPGWTLNNGGTAYLYSAAHPKSVERHCRWMEEYGIDGVFLQRFLGEVQDPRFFTFRNMVTQNIQAGCETHGRLYAIMYDVSGVADADMLGRITNDWNHLVGTLNVTNSPSYAHHNGKPVVSIWGLGFKGRGLTPITATAVINYFKSQGMTVKGGVPDSWRTLNGDSETDPAWAAVYRSFDIISPWTVGRYSTLSGIDSWRVNKIVPDLAEATAAGVDYMPVIFPGFSWYNIHGGPLNQIPRLDGDFYWRQAYNSQFSGCSMLYTAMFDEVDEGTAMFKMAATTNDLPAGATMVPLDIDGTALPSDWYLRVGGEAARMLHGEIPLQISLPISP